MCGSRKRRVLRRFLEFYFFLYAGCVTTRADSRSLWLNYLDSKFSNAIFCCEQSFLVSCLYYKKGISDQFRRQKYSSLRVESSELASRVLRGFAAGIQQPLYAFPLLASRSKGPRKLRPVDAHLTGNGEGPHVRAYRWRGIPPPL